MSPEYIPYITIVIAFASGFSLCALTFGAYCLRGWRREIDRALGRAHCIPGSWHAQ
jgi:hypothetical protein